MKDERSAKEGEGRETIDPEVIYKMLTDEEIVDVPILCSHRNTDT